MRYFCDWISVVLIALLLAGGTAAAQEPDGPTEEDVAAAKKRLEERRAKAIERERLQPVLDAISETNPSSPVQLIGSIETLMNLDQPEEAKRYIRRLQALKLDPEAMYVLQRRVGSGVFFRLSRDKRYHPEGLQLADAVLEAAYQRSRDPARLAALVKELGDPSIGVRSAALSDLKEAGIDGVLALIGVLGDSAREAEHRRIQQALVAMDALAVEPLIGTIFSPDANLRRQAIEILGAIESRVATPYLIQPLWSSRQPPPVRRAAAAALSRIMGTLPTRREGEVYLHNEIEQLTSGDVPRKPDPDGNIQLWLWHAEKRLPVPLTYEASDAALVVAAHLATDLYALAPDNPEYRRVYLMSILESAKLIAGIDRSLPTGEGSARHLAGQAGAAAVEDVLVQALEQDRIAAAIGAVEVLGDVGDERLLLSDDGRPKPLVQALMHSNRRLRFAAAEAIVKIDPHHDYPGASHLPETLGYLAATAGMRRVLIGHPQRATAQSLVGLLAQLGYEADTAVTGRELFLQAVRSPDYDIVLVSDGIDDRPLHETLQTLRKDRRTAWLPIGVMAREENLRILQLRAQDDPLTLVFPRPHEQSALVFQLKRLIELIGRHAISDQERARHASAALAWLTRMAADRQAYGFYDVLRQVPPAVQALFEGQVPVRAAEFLGLIGSAGAQRALVNFASQNARPLAARQAAAKQFVRAVRRRGLLLNDDEIDLQYSRYNQSEFLDTGTQQVLAETLDIIERALLARRSGEQLAEE